MFTGIVSYIGTVHEVEDTPNARSMEIRLPLKAGYGLEPGASVANNGCCLTVTEVTFHFPPDSFQNPVVTSKVFHDFVNGLKPEQRDMLFNMPTDTYFALLRFDLISTTLNLTNLGELKEGDKLNIERSYKVGDEVGGHILSGHIDNTLEIVKVVDQDNVYQLEFALPAEYKQFVYDKGFVAIDGMSLTVSGLTEQGFTVNLIPETLAKTTIGSKKVGDRVNFEIDSNTKTVVNLVQHILSQQNLN